MPCRSVASSVALAVLLAAPLASAHIDLNEPPARHGDPLEDQKQGPCGVADSPRSGSPTVLQPGQTVTIQWDETIDHDGHFRLAFLADGDDFPNPEAFDDLCDPALDDWCVMDGIADDQFEGTFSHDWVVPDTPCDNCTLQLIQVMTDGDGFQLNDLYFDCADVVILDPDGSSSASTGSGAGDGGAGGDPSSGSGDGGASSGDGPSAGAGSAGPGDDDDDDGGVGGGAVTSGGQGAEPRLFPPDEGCSVAAPGAGGVAAVAAPLAAIALALGLRRRRPGAPKTR